MKVPWPTPSTDTPLVSYPLQHFKQLVSELVAKGVGVVDQALREAFQILKRVLHLGKPRGHGGVGNRLRQGKVVPRCSYGAPVPCTVPRGQARKPLQPGHHAAHRRGRGGL